MESKLEQLGIKEPELISLSKDIPSLPEIKNSSAHRTLYWKRGKERIHGYIF